MFVFVPFIDFCRQRQHLRSDRAVARKPVDSNGGPQTETSHDFHGIMGMGWLAEKLQFTDSEMRSKIWFGEKPMGMLGSNNEKLLKVS